jgi:hypothetical protein
MLSTYSAAAERNKNAQVRVSAEPSPRTILAVHDVMLTGDIQLATGYDEVARSLFSDELSTVGNYEIGQMIGKGNCLESGVVLRISIDHLIRVLWQSLSCTSCNDKDKGACFSVPHFAWSFLYLLFWAM